ncbi:hypothetical protein [Streptomyces sp. NPDC050560]|uniref:hypothetical protein n=1 Tax=Streptomyces sp. NPDC050560 TaxID=3365630 RepID=UPI00379D01A1
MNATDRTTRRHPLDREVAGIIGLLADERDFTAMRRYPTFAFTDHPAYLRQIEDLLRARAADGSHTSVALFDPTEFEEYCAAGGLDPDTPTSRAHFTASLAAAGAALAYRGQPLIDLVPDLITASVRQATWEYATAVLADIGDCVVCGEDIGWSAYTRAADLLLRIVDAIGSGDHHLVCSVSTGTQPLLAVLTVTGIDATVDLDEGQAQEFTALLATGLATGAPGGLVTRTTRPGDDDRVFGWRLRHWGLAPLTAAEVFDAYCTDATTGDLVSPESRVDYGTPPDLGEVDPPPGHRH